MGSTAAMSRRSTSSPREIGVTRERVRQIQGEALDKLRAKLARRGYTRDALL